MTTHKDNAHTQPSNGSIGLTATHEHHVKMQYEHNRHDDPDVPHILVVEDDPTLAKLEAGILTAYGYTVVTVHSGEMAITTLHLSIPDLVVLDLELTGNVQGWDVLQALRNVAPIPVLLTTSSATAVRASIRQRGESRFTLDHLPKPYPMQTLLKRVQRMLMTAPE